MFRRKQRKIFSTQCSSAEINENSSKKMISKIGSPKSITRKTQLKQHISIKFIQ